jgi:beta-phosphoglucomutase-like phosphatase (HAD superfamily)
VTEEIVIFDIDGTLADVSERIHHLKKKPKDWNAFFGGMAQDKTIRSMVCLCNLLCASGIQIILCSARSEEHRTIQ